MDINYLLDREQHALHLAETSSSRSARAAHRAFAKAYGLLIAGTGFPHRDISSRGREAPIRSLAFTVAAQIRDWESEGGSIRVEQDPPLPQSTSSVFSAKQFAEKIALARGRLVVFP